MVIYENIRKLCAKENISICRLERETGLSNGTIRSWKRSNPSVGRLKLVADRFGVPLEDLLQEQPSTISVQ